ncbi:lipopolysaccharide assembly protein LapB [Aquimarina sp. U1-2]|uniref:tetratricopeptide repeat protein n=1 Tax=Aquimarina sp. U1-2 TaxID=2823141 RepID=UPI001FEF5F1D|nr:tetratricopeptide repeat protein [Aquimarina sp. U1-2]
MRPGFDLLETGKYVGAKNYFEQVLKKYPQNRTAKICYGRAIGLSGNSKKAVSIFTQLKKEYPDDFEIKLNYAESLLWNKNFGMAKDFYAKLLEEDPTSFPVVLGYANTLSNLKKYPEALQWVNKALVLSAGNENALTSRKYIRLGLAFTLSQNKEYEKALRLLDLNLLDFPGDKDTLLNRVTIFLTINNLEAAKDSYQKLATNPKDSIVALNGLALLSHKKNKDKQALHTATIAVQKVEKFKNNNDVWLSTQERFIQALLWNRKYKKAKLEIKKLREEFPNLNRISNLEATYGMYTNNFDISLDWYKLILNNEQNSFDGNLGIANAYRALGLDSKAYEYAFKTLDYYPKQQDAEKLIRKLKKTHTPFIEEKTTFTFDNGDNDAVSIGLSSEIPLSTKFTTLFNYIYRTTKNTRTNVEATSNDASLGIRYKFNGQMTFLGALGINNSDAFTTNFTQVTAATILQTKPFKLQNLDIGYKRELQNFNADLIDREIIMNNYFLTYNLGTNFNLGWYTQYMYTSQTDDNTRNLLFTSLYYSLLNRPILKTGINYQYLAFKEQLPELYFSPRSFHLGEIFAEIVSDSEKKWFYQVSTAIGKQFVDDDPASLAFRAEGKFGHQFSDRFMSVLYGKYSNIASATAAGFEYIEFGFQLRWYFLKSPIFNKKIEAIKHTK